MIIKGNNFEGEGKYSESLSASLPSLNLTSLGIDDSYAGYVVAQIDNLFLLSSRKRDIPKLKIGKNGKVDLSQGYYFHKLPGPTEKNKDIELLMEGIKSRAQYGILPSERFGYLESAEEMRFCVGVSYCDDLANGVLVKKRYVGNPKYESYDCMMSQTGRLSLIIDPSITENSPEFLSFVNDKKAKTEKEQEIFKFIKNLSPKAEGIVTGLYKSSFTEFNWRAIVGGIPPQYIVGVFVNTEYQDDKTAKESQDIKDTYLDLAEFCSQQFNCPIVTQDGNVSYHLPKREHTM